jgi:hypothetical protein
LRRTNFLQIKKEKSARRVDRNKKIKSRVGLAKIKKNQTILKGKWQTKIILKISIKLKLKREIK